VLTNALCWNGTEGGVETIILITGASGGLGSAVTSEFLANGDRVIGVSRSIKQNEFPHDKFVAYPADITQDDKARALVDSVTERFGRIDSLVHVMGGFAAGTVHETDDATWAKMRDMNLTAAFNIARAVIPVMRKARAGKIIAVGSRVAHERHAGIAAYSAFKVALASLIQSIAAENKRFGITANIVLPGTMDTPGNRSPGADTTLWVPPQAVAKLIIFLASDAASHVNAAEIPVSGFDL
jgi:NAD(P)-dependent dehydrogenase (short-subunit alcohol dehydrogenase family)